LNIINDEGGERGRQKKSPDAEARGLPFFGRSIESGEAAPEWTRGLLFGLGLPGVNNILCRMVTKGSYCRLFGDFSAVFEDDGYELGISLFSILNGNGFEAL